MYVLEKDQLGMSCLYRVYTSRRSILFLSLTCNQFSPIERLLFLDLEGLPVQFQSYENRGNLGGRLKVPLFRYGAGGDSHGLQQDTYISRSHILMLVIAQ